MSLRDVVARAGSFDVLLPDLKKGAAGILARATEGFYSPDGTPEECKDDHIPGWWWGQLREVNPAASRATFWMTIMPGDGPHDKGVTTDILACGIELDQVAVEALFPEAPEPAAREEKPAQPEAPAPVPVSAPVAAPRHAGGRPTEWSWGDAAQYVDRSVAQHGPLPRDNEGKPILANAFRLMREFFDVNEPPGPDDSLIYRWLKQNPRTWWD